MSASDKPRIRWFTIKNLILMVVAVLVTLPILLLLAYANGRVVGEEFSPDDFSRREFEYNRPSWLPITFQGISYSSHTNSFIPSLLQNRTIAEIKPVTRWDLVSDNRMPTDSTAYDARILCRYLDLQDESGQSLWEGWNSRHPEKAKLFWPYIAKLARSGNYYLVPDLMEFAIANGGLTNEEFRVNIDQLWSRLTRQFELDLVVEIPD
jgi:hypothetical protein